MAARQMQWGFPRFQGKGLLINARVEAILDKKTFRDSVLHRRCVIPAHHFYEWSKNKEKYTFQSPKQDATLFMAGCYQIYNGQNSGMREKSIRASAMGRTHGLPFSSG